jgi:S1-C subfamily serine protease
VADVRPFARGARARYIGVVKEVIMTFRISAMRLAEVALAASLALAPFPSPSALRCHADDAGSKAATAQPLPPDAEKFFQSIFKVKIRAVPNARSSATLGQEREGTAVVIGDDGLLVTIGYLIVEADEVSLVDQQGKTIPRASSRMTTRPASARARTHAALRAGRCRLENPGSSRRKIR